MHLNKVFFLALVLSSFISLLPAQDVEDFPVAIEKIEKRAVQKYISNPDLETYRYTEDTEITSDETITGNVIVVRGDLTIHGTVDGDILVLLGNVNLQPKGVVNGDVTCIEGKITQSRSSLISGRQIETKIKNIYTRSEWTDRYSESEWEYFSNFELDDLRRTHYGAYSTLPIYSKDEPVVFSYNRVQGLFLGISAPKIVGSRYDLFDLHGFGGYGFAEKKWRYKLGLDRWLFSPKTYRFELGAEIHDLTDSRDSWMLSPLENSLASILLHEDFHDFYRRKGYSFHASQNLSIFLKGSLEYRHDLYSSVEKNTDWAVFGGKKKFAENPPIEEGRMRSLYGEIYLDTRDNNIHPKRGWYGLLGAESSTSKMNSDFSFNQYLLDLRTYQPFGRGERLDIRLRAGTSEGTLPLQKVFELGGMGSLRGFGFKEFSGNRMLLANFEYNINPQIFNTSLLFDEFHYVFFYDAGAAWFTDPAAGAAWHEGFENLKWASLKANIGIALTNRDGDVRLNIANRTDTSKESVVVTLRIVKPF